MASCSAAFLRPSSFRAWTEACRRPFAAGQLAGSFSAGPVTRHTNGSALHMRQASSSPSSPLHVVVGMSGGVDSSVTAYLLKRAGFRVTGCFMRNWDRNEEAGAGLDSTPCPADADYASAKSVAEKLGIPLSVANFEREYWREVFEPLLSAYAAGRTPNPDVACNRFVKFGAFRTHALRVLGADCVATGHYAQIWPPIVSPSRSDLPRQHQVLQQVEGKGADAEQPLLVHASALPQPPFPRLYSAVDGVKDQSDFLCMVRGGDLRGVMLPLGGYTKPTVRRVAKAMGLSSASRRDSYGICFVGKRSLGAFLGGYIPPVPGVFVDVETGREVGKCADAQAVTVGQSARVSGQKEKLYIVSTGLAAGTGTGLIQPPGLARDTTVPAPPLVSAPPPVPVLVCPGEHHPALYTDCAAVRMDEFSWVAGAPPEQLRTAVEDARQRAGDAARVDAFVAALSSWLRTRGPAKGDDAQASRDAAREEEEEEPALPTLAVRFRDRHRQDEMLSGSATVVRASEWERACAILRRDAAEGERSNRSQKTTSQGVEARASSRPDDPLVLVRFDAPHRAITPGQVLVLYSVTQGVGGSDGSVAVGPLPDPVPTGAESAQGGAEEEKGEKQWSGAGRECFGGGPLLGAGPSWWELGFRGKSVKSRDAPK
jgi:tRNA U34 2-thiouridine synthase MnmA/TrmU